MSWSHFDEEENGFVAVGGAFATYAEGVREDDVEMGAFDYRVDFCGAEANATWIQRSVAVMGISMEDSSPWSRVIMTYLRPWIWAPPVCGLYWTLLELVGSDTFS